MWGIPRAPLLLLPLLLPLASGVSEELQHEARTIASPLHNSDNGRKEFQPMIRGTIIDGHFIPTKGANRAVRGGSPGEFNLYIFSMSWKAEWCYHEEYPGCETPRSFWEDNLTIHGLWPDYGDGKYPTVCTKEAFDHNAVVDAVGMDELEEMWPNIQVAEDEGKKYDSFWEHEWNKHGTCTGLSQVEYFSTGLSLLKDRFPTPAVLAAAVGSSMPREDLEAAYGGKGMVVLECHGHHDDVHLNQVMLCLKKDEETGGPGELMACPPPIVGHDDTCGSGMLNIASF